MKTLFSIAITLPVLLVWNASFGIVDAWAQEDPEAETSYADAAEKAASQGSQPEDEVKQAYPMKLSAEAKELAAELEQKLLPGTEARAMLDAIMTGDRLRPNVGWFALSKSGTALDWSTVIGKLDANQNQQISPDEVGHEQWFASMDRDQDGKVTASDFEWESIPGIPSAERNEASSQHKAADRGDHAASDGEASKREPEARREKRSRPSSNLSREVLIYGLARQEIGSHQPGPSVGEIAPDFVLATADRSQKIRLHEQLGGKPIVLVFGNFTCGPFRRQSEQVREAFARYGKQANFLMVYVREAHPRDGWHSETWEEPFLIEQPVEKAEREAIARTCQQHVEYDFPFLVDEMDDPVGSLYSGMPSRLYVLDTDGKIIFKSARGPHGFKPAQMEQALAAWLAIHAE